MVDRVIVLARGTVLADGSVPQVMASDDRWIRDYFAVRASASASADAGANDGS